MSDAARWARIKHLFHQSQEQPETEREHWLTDQCGDDEDLLREIRGLLGAQHASHDILDAGAVGVLRQIGTGELTPDLSGQRIGAYRLLRLIGEGGMGSVFLAERDGADFSQRVALKLIRADFVSAETSARFLRERNFLARLVHPHIAQLHDGGVAADGTPYFTLEYVEGAPITKYCDAHALDIRGRLQLILQVCAAVSYAHRNLIVHRDLKPSNILVAADGTAKLLDFGIAKLLDTEPGDGHTATHARMMTPEYAAPEQVLGEPITTATDVYSIGVLLYELLCGRLPYARADAGVISWSKAVVEETPEPVYRALTRLTTRGASATGDAAAAARGTVLPTLRRSLRGDLDRILQRALAKSPEARYSSVSAFAADISAHLDGNAISGGTRTYQMRKFLRRHWLPLVASSAILLLAVISAIAMAWQAARIEREAKTTAVVKDFLIGLFNAVDPNAAKGKEVTARELLDRGKTSINAMPSNDPQVKGELQSVLGRIDFQLGNYAEAGELQRQAIETLRTSADGLRQMIATELDRAETLRIAGNLKDAQGMIDAAATDLQQASQPLIGERARLLITRSNATMQKHHFDEAMPDAAAAVALLRPVGNADGQLELALENVGNIELGRHALDAAETNYREALQLALQRQGPDGLMVASLHINLGWVLAERSRYEEDLIETRQGLDIESRVLGAEHPRTLIIQMQTGTILYHLGHYAQARELLESVVASQRRVLGPDSPYVAGTLANLGLSLTEQRDLDAAEQAFTEGMAISEKKFGAGWGGIDVARGYLGYVHLLQGKLDLADQELTATETADLKRNKKDSAGDCYRLGELARLRGNTTQARQWNERAVNAAQGSLGEKSEQAALAHHYLGLALRDSGDAAAAEKEWRAALASFVGYIPNAAHPFAATTRYELGLLLIQRDDTREEGIRLLTESMNLREKFLGTDEPRTQQARAALAQVQPAVKSG